MAKRIRWMSYLVRAQSTHARQKQDNDPTFTVCRQEGEAKVITQPAGVTWFALLFQRLKINDGCNVMTLF
jgi:hypothetical protein